MVKINSRGPVPKYFRLREILLDLIDAELSRRPPSRPSGSWPNGTDCPG